MEVFNLSIQKSFLSIGTFISAAFKLFSSIASLSQVKPLFSIKAFASVLLFAFFKTIINLGAGGLVQNEPYVKASSRHVECVYGNIADNLDYDDDGVIDNANLSTAMEYTVTSPNSGRYFVEITTISGAPPETDDILIIFHSAPLEADVEVVVLSDLADRNRVEVVVDGTSEYVYSLNNSFTNVI